MDYTTLSLVDVRRELDAAGRAVQSTFGTLTPQQVNWRPDATQWSVAQCFEHMLTVNTKVLARMDAALAPSASKSIWQRMPILPGFVGRMLVGSQAPTNVRKFKAPPAAAPAASDLDPAVVSRFAGQMTSAAQRAQAFDERAIAQVIMTSPFFKPVVFSVLDGWRLLVAHSHRHIEQAKRVMQSPGFPR